MNPIELVWAMMTARVYRDGRVFTSRKELQKAVSEAWEEISLDQINRLLDVRKDRLVSIIRAPEIVHSH